MKYLFISIFVTITACNHSSTTYLSAKQLNDSVIAITNHYKDTTKFEKAIKFLNKAIEKDSTMFELFKTKYFLEVSIGDYRSALETNERLIKFRPDSAELHFQAATFEQYMWDTIQSKKSFAKAVQLYKLTLDTMNKKSPYYFYDWKMWAFSVIMIGPEDIIHNFLKENCTTAFDSSTYSPEMLGKTKSELQELIIEKLTDLKYRGSAR